VQSPDPKYFDYAASAPPFPEAMEVFCETSIRFPANPSSQHKAGKDANKKLLETKKEFCDLLHFSDGRLLLCSSGTESNNMIIEGHRKRHPKGRLLIAEDTHNSLWYAREKHRTSTDILKINRSGQIAPEHLLTSIKPTTTLVCINHVCNELGTIHPVSNIADICAVRGIKLLIDGVQAMGHIPVELDKIAVDYYSFSAHKFGGPRSVGGIFIRDGEFEPMLHGGDQEWGLRASTENVAGLGAAVTALKLCLKSIKSEMERLSEFKEHLLKNLKAKIPELLINSPDESQPGFISMSFPGVSGNEIVSAMSLSGYSISTGSACHANQIEPSRIILAMGMNKKEAIGTIRITMGPGTTGQSVRGLKESLIEMTSLSI